MLKYSYLPTIKKVTFGIINDFTINHYLDLINASTSEKQIFFLFKQILQLLNLTPCKQQQELVKLSLRL